MGSEMCIRDSLDGIGGFCLYGLIENSPSARSLNALPISLSEGCRLLRDVAKDDVVRFDDVERPADRLVDRLWSEQARRWPQEGAERGAATSATRTPLRPAERA